MRSLLLQLDGKIPNIALMRLAAELRSSGEQFAFKKIGNAEALDRTLQQHRGPVFASLIFEKTRPLAERLLAARPSAIVGGTGWDLTTTLESIGVTTREQDYSLYPGWTQSIGFTQRGCRLKCSFCVVPRKEGKVVEEQTIEELWRGKPYPRHLLLLDNDFFGQPNWRARIAELRECACGAVVGCGKKSCEGPFKVSFNQGINARFLDEESAAAITSVDYRDDSMEHKRIYTAWDSNGDEKRLMRGLELLVANGARPRHIMVYLLIGYWPGETHEDRDYRRARLREFGALPYPMPFVRTQELVGFQRWVIGSYDKRGVSWADWEEARYQPRNLGKLKQLRLFPREAFVPVTEGE